jgi:prepilin-type N-terminal cleavage/methylation domain-containing protein/prepilin-type processing-associated H-X9-DG protein
MPHSRLLRRTGFSLIELLVVIAIIGLLLSLLLPAVQAAREASRRLGCSNNLHQIGIGMHGYHDTYKRFPMGGLEMRSLRLTNGSPRYPHGVQLAWSACILPFIELQSIAKQIDYKKGFDSPENAQAASEIISTYLCPSVSRQSYATQGRGACDYGGIYGERIVSNNSPARGVLIYTQYVRIREITDGTSRTLMVSEDCQSQDMQWINGLNVFDVSYAINTAPAVDDDLHSKHMGGVNGLMADGAVRFLANEMDLQTLAAICTRNGDEAIGDF